MNKKKYDLIIVGAGPAGVFCAFELSRLTENKAKILLVEQGKKIELRDCPRDKVGKCLKCELCSITAGFAGAGAGSDGKCSLYNHYDDDIYVGGELHKYIGVDPCKDLIDYTDSVYLDFGATKELKGIGHEAEIAKIRKKASKANLETVSIPIRHLGTEGARAVYKNLQDFLEEKGIDILFETKVDDLISDNNQVKGIKCGAETFYADKVAVAVGRGGAGWLLDICQKHNIKTTPGIVDIGVRYELPNDIMENINTYMYEGKFIGRCEPFSDKVRTFCQNPSGFVTTEAYDGGIICVNGHSMLKKKSENTNLALLVSLDLKKMEDPMEYARNIARNINRLAGNNVMVQRLGDVRQGKRTWPEEIEKNSVRPTLEAVPGDLSLGFPYRVMMDIISFIDSMNKLVEGFGNDDNLLYGPEIKFYSNKVRLTTKLETSMNGLYAIGDGCGLTRGLMMASASGVQLARNLFEIQNR